MMQSEKPRVVVFTGDDMQAMAGGRWFACALQSRFGLDVEVVSSYRKTPRQFRSQVKKVFCSGSDQPLVVVYNGHGGTTGWGPWENRRERFEYCVLADLATRYRGPVQFINCACFALEMAYEFQKRKVPHDRVGVIAACEGSWTSITTLLLRQVVEAWQRGVVYRPGYMGEAYFLPVPKQPGATHPIFLEKGRTRGVWQAVQRILFRPALALLSLRWPLEHSTYFSRRWGATHDKLIVDRLRRERVPVLRDELIGEFMSFLHRQFPGVFRAVFPAIDALLWRFMPPRPE